MPDELETIVLEQTIDLFLLLYGTDLRVRVRSRCLITSKEFYILVDIEGKDIIMLGDINCDLLAEEPCCYTKRLNNITSTSHLNQLISEATRITEDTESLLDHVYVSDLNKVVNGLQLAKMKKEYS